MPKPASSLRQGLRMMQIGLNRVVLLGVLSFGETFFRIKGLRRPAEPLPRLQDVKSILVWRLDERIGDFVLMTPFLRERTLTGWWQLVRRLRKAAPCLVVSFSPSSFGLALAAFLSGAPERFGFSVRPVQRRFFTTALPFQLERHVADDYLALAEMAKGKGERHIPHVFLTDDEREQAYQTLRALGWDGTTPLLGCHPFSSVAKKEWGDDNFAKLLTWARERWSFCPIIFGGPAEQSRAERLAAQVQGISAAGKLPLRAFIAAASWCAAFVGGDSGPVHIAAALGIPTLALYGPTDPQRTGPL